MTFVFFATDEEAEILGFSMPSVLSTFVASAWLAHSLKVHPWSKVHCIRFLLVAFIPRHRLAIRNDRITILIVIGDIVVSY